MKISRSSTIQSLILAAALSIGPGFVSPVSAAQHAYLVDLNSKTATDLGTLGGAYDVPYGINDAGQVVGVSYGGGSGYDRAFITGPDGMGMRDLGTLGGNGSAAHGINDAGQVVGTSHTDKDSYIYHAFITGPNGMGMRDLGILGAPDGSEFSEANGINDAGQVVGVSGYAAAFSSPFITGPNGMGMRDLGNLGGHFSAANGINDAGQVVGVSGTAAGDLYHAFITGPDGMGMRDLGTGGTESHANGINDAGQVVGQFNGHAFVTGPNGVGMTDLSFGEAFGINDAGRVVGQFYTAAGHGHAFITGPNGMGMTDLNSLVSLPGGVVLSEATGINNHGQVIALGSLIPEPETYAMLLAGLGLVRVMMRRKKISEATFSLG